MAHCRDCGHILERNGICQNCHEEAWIEDWQGYQERQTSREWDERVEDQRRQAKRNVNDQQREKTKWADDWED